MGAYTELHTRSGAVYLVDEAAGRLMRQEGPHSPGINYARVPDGEWHSFVMTGDFAVGESASFILADHTWRVTTPLVKIVPGKVAA